jgi:hypothetical protein
MLVISTLGGSFDYIPPLVGRSAMSRAKASGYVLSADDAPIIFGMIARDDRDHDIAAWFGVNQGRIAEVKDGTKFGLVSAAPADQLPPKGAPGPKGRQLRELVDIALSALKTHKDIASAIDTLEIAIGAYDAHEQ